MSSFSINIGSTEARECGLVAEDGKECVVIKLIDTERQQVIIKPKKCTLTSDLIQQVIEKATKLQRLNELLMESVPSVGGLVDISSIPQRGIDKDNEYVNRVYAMERELEKFLLELPLETITDLMTLMYMGRSCDADMKVAPLDRFVDYWCYLAECGCFSDEAYNMVSQMLEKSPLPDYLKRGAEITLQPPQEDDDDYDVDGGEYLDEEY